MRALTGKQASLSVRSNQDMLTTERDVAAGGEQCADNERACGRRRRSAADHTDPHAARPGSQPELVESGYPALVSALEGFAGEPGDIHVDPAGLAFSVVVRLIRASGPGHGATRVVLHEVPPHLKAVLRIVGWDCTPGLAPHEQDSSIPPRSGTVTGGGRMAARRVVGPGGLGRLGYRTIVVKSAAPGSILERRC